MKKHDTQTLVKDNVITLTKKSHPLLAILIKYFRLTIIAIMIIITLAVATNNVAASEFNDTFTRANSATLGNGWYENPEQAGTTAEILSNELKITDANTGNYVAVWHPITPFDSGVLEFNIRTAQTTINNYR
jgi:hypothetical protein